MNATFRQRTTSKRRNFATHVSDRYASYPFLQYYFKRAGLTRRYKWIELAAQLDISWEAMLELKRGHRTSSLTIASRLSRKLGGPIAAWYAGPPIGYFSMPYWFDELTPEQELHWVRIRHHTWKRVATGHRIRMARADSRFSTSINGKRRWFRSVRAAAAKVDEVVALERYDACRSALNSSSNRGRKKKCRV